MSHDLDVVRKSISATLADMKLGRERFIAENGIDPFEPEDWMELKDIIARIERRLGAELAA